MFVIKGFSFRVLVADITTWWKDSCEHVLLVIWLICNILRFLNSRNNLFEKKSPHLKEMLKLM